MGIFRTFRTFRTVLEGGDEIFMVLLNYLSPPVPTLSFFVLDHPPLLLGKFEQAGSANRTPCSITAFLVLSAFP